MTSPAAPENWRRAGSAAMPTQLVRTFRLLSPPPWSPRLTTARRDAAPSPPVPPRWRPPPLPALAHCNRSASASAPPCWRPGQQGAPPPLPPTRPRPITAGSCPPRPAASPPSASIAPRCFSRSARKGAAVEEGGPRSPPESPAGPRSRPLQVARACRSQRPPEEPGAPS